MVTDTWCRQSLLYSIAYMCYDTTCMYFEGTIDFFTVLHHIFSVLGLYLPYRSGINGVYAMVGLFITEMSHPFMSTKNFSKMFGKRYTRLYEVSEILFLIVYLLGRGILSWNYVYRCITCPSNHLFFKLTCFGLLL
jgi:hypothetical protein